MADGIQAALTKLKSQREEASSTEDKPDGDAVDVTEVTAETETEAEVAEVEVTEQLSEEVEDVQASESDEELDNLIYEINGKDYTQKEITDALDGNLRLSDYTRKSQLNAEERKTLEADRGKLSGKMDELQSHIDLLSDMSDAEFKDIDWDDLRDTDTAEYLRLKEKQESKKGKLTKAQADRQALLDTKRQELGQAEGAKLFDVLGWRDNTVKQKADSALIQSYITDAGWTDAEFGEVINHKHMVVILEAAKYHELKSKAAITTKKVKQAPTVVRGKKASVTNIQKQVNDARAKLKQTGKLADAMTLQKLEKQL